MILLTEETILSQVPSAVLLVSIEQAALPVSFDALHRVLSACGTVKRLIVVRKAGVQVCAQGSLFLTAARIQAVAVLLFCLQCQR